MRVGVWFQTKLVLDPENEVQNLDYNDRRR